MNGTISIGKEHGGGIVHHPLYGFSLCYNGGYGCFASDLPDPEHGTSVICSTCRRAGVIPDDGYDLEFMPPGTQRAPGGGYILNLQAPG